MDGPIKSDNLSVHLTLQLAVSLVVDRGLLLYAMVAQVASISKEKNTKFYLLYNIFLTS